jgi:hypothetical protein
MAGTYIKSYTVSLHSFAASTAFGIKRSTHECSDMSSSSHWQMQLQTTLSLADTEGNSAKYF